MVEDAKFWVVAPRITPERDLRASARCSRATTSASRPARPTKSSATFTGLEMPPDHHRRQPGRQFVLKAADLGSLGIGSPIYYRRLQAGQVVAYDLAERRQGDRGQDLRQRALRPVRQPRHALLERERHRRVARRERHRRAHRVAGRAARGRPRVRHAARSRARPSPPRPNTVFTLYADRAAAMKQPDAIARALRALLQRVAARAVGGRAGHPSSACRRARSPTSGSTSTRRPRHPRARGGRRLSRAPRRAPGPGAGGRGRQLTRSRQSATAHPAARRAARAARAAPQRQPAHRPALRGPRLLPGRAQGDDRLERRRPVLPGGPQHAPGARGEAQRHRRQAREAAARRRSAPTSPRRWPRSTSR